MVANLSRNISLASSISTPILAGNSPELMCPALQISFEGFAQDVSGAAHLAVPVDQIFDHARFMAVGAAGIDHQVLAARGYRGGR